MSGQLPFPEGDREAAVLTRGLSVNDRGTAVLESVDLRVPEGSIYVLVGANGAGKSTVMKVLVNLMRPSSGTAQVFGLDTSREGPRVRAQVGYVPERSHGGYGRMTGEALLRHVAAYYPTWDRAYAAFLGQVLGLELRRRTTRLSPGELRRLHILLALSHRPPLLVLDEPTEGLDPVVRKRVLVLLAEHLADSPTTVLIATHRIYELEGLADHVGVLEGGRLLAQMPREELHRTVRRYSAEVPEGWRTPPGVRVTELRRSPSGRQIQLTVVGEEREVTGRLASAGARVHEVASLGLEDAALAFVSEVVP